MQICVARWGCVWSKNDPGPDDPGSSCIGLQPVDSWHAAMQ